jgi:hypothetical protein
MFKKRRLLCIFALMFGVVYVGNGEAATIVAASCNAADVQSALSRAVDGDTVVIPEGSCTWSTGITVTKAITMNGSGTCGGYVGESASSVDIGTGSKSFTTRPGLDFRAGERITARYINRQGAHSMTGTVASYANATLVLNVTSVTGSGTWRSWVFERPGSTNIINSAVSAQFQPMLALTESTAGSIKIGCLTFKNGTAVNGSHITIKPIGGGRPVLVHDSWFQVDGGLQHAIYLEANRGVFYRNSYNGRLCSHSSVCAEGTNSAVVVGNESLTSSWTTASTMGTADTTGTGNIYVEDSYFVGFMQSAAGTDSGGRMVLRDNIFNHAVIGTHGADTSNLGMRHLEIYDNRFIFHNLGDVDTWNLNYWVFQRGGTAVVTGNTFDNISSSMWGDKQEYTMTVLNLQRNAGPNPCWGADKPGNQIPAPRQVGYGHVTGGGVDGLGRSSDGIAYVGDREPVYIWNNSGTLSVGTSDDGAFNCGASVYDNSWAYIVQDREYFLSAKPNYTRYAYPHPLTGSGSAPTATPSVPSNLRIIR